MKETREIDIEITPTGIAFYLGMEYVCVSEGTKAVCKMLEQFGYSLNFVEIGY